MLSIFFIYLLLLTQKEKYEKEKEKPFIKNVYTMEAIQWTFIVY